LPATKLNTCLRSDFFLLIFRACGRGSIYNQLSSVLATSSSAALLCGNGYGYGHGYGYVLCATWPDN